MRLRLRALFPFAWVVLPVLGACLVAVLATEAGGPASRPAAGRRHRTDRRLCHRAASARARPSWPSASPAATVTPSCRSSPRVRSPSLPKPLKSLRAAVIKADSLAVDQRRREAEARLHYAGRSFFTRRFRSAVDEVTNAFADGSGRIGNTAADLAERNRHMHVRIAALRMPRSRRRRTSTPSPPPRAPSSRASGAQPETSAYRARPATAPSPISSRPTRPCAAWRKPRCASARW